MVSERFTGSVLSAALGLPIAPGAADYDLRDWCEIVSDASGGSYVIFNGCMRDKAEAAAELAVMPPLSAGITRRCHDVATVATLSGGSIRMFLLRAGRASVPLRRAACAIR
jgi:hypothetical protein